MATYMIHSCNKRLWYVFNYLIPSMKKQGICETDIILVNDTYNRGNLEGTMSSFRSLPYRGFTWHLQDDIIISPNFKELTEFYDSNSLYDCICGFCSKYDKGGKGFADVDSMWYSFPCIRIRNSIAKQCGKWFYLDARYRKEYQAEIRRKRWDDSFFREYLKQYQQDIKAYNLNPNIVDHIDWLIGGSIINKQRGKEKIRSLYWPNEYNQLVNELERQIHEDKKS